MNAARTSYLNIVSTSLTKSNIDPETYVRELATIYLNCLRSEMFDSIFEGKKEGEVSVKDVNDCNNIGRKLTFVDLVANYFDDFSAIIHQARTDLSDDFIKVALA